MADHKAAALNFLNALERIPKLIEQYSTQNVTLERDIPTLHEVVNSTWKKEEELKKLKSEVSALERKIQLTLTPKQEKQPEDENSRQESVPTEVMIGRSMGMMERRQPVHVHI